MDSAIFLDRDGVIIENRANYIRSWVDVFIFPQALKALSAFSQLPYRIVIVTNQSVIGRGIITYKEASQINSRLIEQITLVGGRIDGVFMCPHTPAINCNCRKPKPGLLIEAATKLSLDLKNSLMIGDALSDLKAGQNAGVKKTILVRTGRGHEQSQLEEVKNLLPFLTCNTLLDVYKYLFQ